MTQSRVKQTVKRRAAPKRKAKRRQRQAEAAFVGGLLRVTFAAIAQHILDQPEWKVVLEDSKPTPSPSPSPVRELSPVEYTVKSRRAIGYGGAP